jgi:phosphoenolpyruvate-protein phosphotransferase (PTS system enzyme I)
MKKLLGIPASNGIAIAKAFKIEETVFNISQKKANSIEAEKKRFAAAILKAKQDIIKIRQIVSKKIDEEHAQVFDAHLQMLEDPEIIDQTLNELNNQGFIVEYHFQSVAKNVADMFSAMDNAYMRERAVDVKDVARRVLSHLTKTPLADPSLIDEQVVIIAKDLTPSDTATLDKKFVLGFATEIGGKTSHSAIMARSLEVPAIVGTKQLLVSIKHGDTLIIDGTKGELIINPNLEQIKFYNDLIKSDKQTSLKLKSLVNVATTTKCGHRLELAANIGSDDDLQQVLDNGAEGIGLYRTEFLYMKNTRLPTEEEQYNAYKKVLDKLHNQKVIIRTLDIGGDKDLPYLKIQKEDNPFLGHRALRYCLDNQELFKIQLRALLRANKHGNLHVMFPMVATLEEVIAAKKIVKEVEIELKKTQVIKDYKLGIMIEIPSAALIAEILIKEVDFFSIGTNDLIQYTMAADRINQKVAYLYQPFNPGVLKLIKHVIDASHAAGKWTGMCGEMAGDLTASVMLLGLGLDEFSMSASSILPMRNLLAKLDLASAKALSIKLMKLGSHTQIKQELENYLSKLK